MTHIVDALDTEKSICEYYTDGGIMEVVQYVFHEERVRDEILFKIPELHNIIFVTEAFIQRVRDEELIGFRFPEVYPHTEDPWAFLKKKKK